MQATRKNMQRMEEAVVEADDQQLQHMLTDSPWDERAVLDQVALDANRHLGATADNCLLIDESSNAQEGDALGGRGAAMERAPRQGRQLPSGR